MVAARGQVRIVGGRFRGRRLPVVEQPGLRPTADRVRETLFNWLAPRLPGARCLDAFAGSGALGFEAVSRGCAELVMLEQAPAAVRQLRQNAAVLGIGHLNIHQTDSLRWLATAPRATFDVVFLDPPFAARLMAPTLEQLASGGWLAPGAHLYLETAARTPLPGLPDGWELVRDKTAGQVRFALAKTPG